MFQLLGTPNQQEIARVALSRCTFPFELLAPKLKADTGRDLIPIEWQDLSRYSEQLTASKASDGHTHFYEGGDIGHPIEVRERVLGLAWYSGKISMDTGLEREPELAAEVMISEISHMIDFFFMTDEQRRLIFNAFHGSIHDPAEHGHGWFDIGSYRSQAGEAFMGAFVKAYSDVGVTIPFAHPVTPFVVRRVQEVLTPSPLPPPPLPPQPESESAEVFGVGRGEVYHDAHAGIHHEFKWPDAHAAESAGRRPCKVCRPHNH